MIVAIGNTKGGVGKTTLAVQVAVTRALAGKDVWLVDGDRQGTSTTAIAARAELGKSPGIACAQYPDGKTLGAQIHQQREKWDDIIIDVGGRDSTALRAALIVADVLLVPFAPRSYDVWALEDMSGLIDEANDQRAVYGLNPIKAFAVMNQAEPGLFSTDNAEAEAAVSELKQFVYLPTSIRRRKAYSNAGGSGLAVSEISPKDAKAVSEIEALIKHLFNV